MAHPPHKAEPIVVARDARVSELAQAALHSASEQVRLNTRGARAGKDPDYTHQLRVGARRARVVLRLFRKYLEPSRVRGLERDLRWIFRALGEVRDRDVLLARVGAWSTDEQSSSAVPPSATELLRDELTRQRNRMARTAARALVSKRYTAMLRTLGRFTQALDPAEEGSRDSPRARKWAKKRLRKRLDAVLALHAAAAGADDEVRHELRKELKKLRYTAELVRSLWRPKRVKRYLASMSDLQDALGVLNDGTTGKRLLDAAAAQVDGAATVACKTFQRQLSASQASMLGQLAPAFQAFANSTPFWE